MSRRSSRRACSDPETAATGDARSSARSRRPRPRFTACRSSASTSTRSGRSTASPTSSARRSAWTCSTSRRSPVRPMPTGTGTVKAAHGIMPVPTPGTLELLKGVPLAPSQVEFELTTPTGAAILTTVVSEYTATPAMTVERIGHGAGTKDFLDRPEHPAAFGWYRRLNTKHQTPDTNPRPIRSSSSKPTSTMCARDDRLLHRTALRGRRARRVRRSRGR